MLWNTYCIWGYNRTYTNKTIPTLIETTIWCALEGDLLDMAVFSVVSMKPNLGGRMTCSWRWALQSNVLQIQQRDLLMGNMCSTNFHDCVSSKKHRPKSKGDFSMYPLVIKHGNWEFPCGESLAINLQLRDFPPVELLEGNRPTSGSMVDQQPVVWWDDEWHVLIIRKWNMWNDVKCKCICTCKIDLCNSKCKM